MSPDDVKALRDELGCTARELAAALDVEAEVVIGWERGELFPTKRSVDRMTELRKKGPSAVPRRRRRGAPQAPMQVLADPELWRVLRKLVAHAELRSQVVALASTYADPADDSPS